MKKVFVILILLLLGTANVKANGGFVSTSIAGDLIFDPFASENAEIKKEKLLIDLRPFKNRQYAKVIAEYEVCFHEQSDTLLFLFVAKNLKDSAFTIHLNGKEMPCLLQDSSEINRIKFPKVGTPWGNADHDHSWQNEPEKLSKKLLMCKMQIPEGVHTLRIQYYANPVITKLYSGKSLTKVHSFHYALYPVKTWKDFSNLHIKVLCPKYWEIENNLKMQLGEDNILTGQWDELPADFLSIHLRMPETLPLAISMAYEIFSLIALVFISIFMYRIIREIRVRWPWIRKIFIALLLILSPFVSVFVYFKIFLQKESLLGGLFNQQYIFDSYREYLVLVSPLPVFLLILINLIVYFVLDKKAKVKRIPR